MKHIEFGDILSVTNGIIVHGCNAQGVMNSGLGRQIRDKYPQAFESYQAHVQSVLETERAKLLGSVAFCEVRDGLVIANAITQYSYGRDSSVRYVDYKAVKHAFDAVLFTAYRQHYHVHYPQIGAGLGNGDWCLISEIIGSVFEGERVEHTLWVRP